MAKIVAAEVIWVKRAGVIGGLAISIACMLVLSISVKRREERDAFEISRTYTIQGDGYKHTKMDVIVNIEGYDINEMFDTIKEEHDRMNGEADKLLIRLYDSRGDLKAHICAGERVYIKDGERPWQVKGLGGQESGVILPQV